VSKHREQIVAAAEGKIEEEILGAAFAKPRGATTAGVGGGLIPTEIGVRWAGKQHRVPVQLESSSAIREPSR
jgi:hypothetical protein